MIPPAFLVLLLLSITPTPSAFHPLKSGKLVSIQTKTVSAFEIIEKANANLTKWLIHGDIMPNLRRNAGPCTATDCTWPKSGSYVYVPIEISSDFTEEQRDIIITSLVAFHETTCIRFVWRSNEEDFLNFFSGTGCWSFLGRQDNGQQISLQKDGCVAISIVQHEVLHALGFVHEQERSDRDEYIDIHLENVEPGLESNFEKIETNNLGTPYDFNSVMQYYNYAFSKNGLPTITAKCDPDLPIGEASEMSSNDIDRVNRLYQCF